MRPRRPGPQPHRERSAADHPFQLTCQTLSTIWYATAGHDPADLDDRRNRAPWYTTKTEPSTSDMAAKLRRVIIAA